MQSRCKLRQAGPLSDSVSWLPAGLEQQNRLMGKKVLMKSDLSLILGFTMIAALGCADIQVIKTGTTVTIDLPPKAPSEIVIYRSTKPEWKFEEIGVVSVRNIKRISRIYEVMRLEAGEKGADAIIGFKFNSEKRTVPVTKTETDAKGKSHTTTELETQIRYSATGTLIHRKE
jgi:hypothetical protein